MRTQEVNRRRRAANKIVNDSIQALRDMAVIQDMHDYWFYLVALRRFWFGYFKLDKLKR